MLRLISAVIFNGNNRYGKVAANLTVNDPHSGNRCAKCQFSVCPEG